MNISIEQYRVRIGLHNNSRCKRNGLSRCSQTCLTSIYDGLCGLVPAAQIFLMYVLAIVSILNHLLDCFQEYIISNHPTTSFNSASYLNTKATNSKFDPNLYKTNYRLVLSCILYCLISMIQRVVNRCYSSNFKTFVVNTYSRLFYKKSFVDCCINIYSLWLLSLNLILIILTIPNISNPGPLKELNILYHNVEGFVNLRDKSPSPQLFTSKVIDFQGHIFHEKPDIVILNETWLKGSVLDSEIFPNNSYKVFRRDRSDKSHPYDDKHPQKFKKQGGGVVIAFRSDLDVETAEFKVTGKAAKAEVLSVVLKSGSGGKVCISTLYRVGTLGTENLSEVNRHLLSIARSKSIHKHILVGDFNLNKTTWP